MSDTTTNAETKGYKTSEFWVMIVTSIITWLNMSGLLGSFQIPIEALADLINLAIAYIVGRTGVKVGSSVIKAKVANTPT